MTNPWHPRGPNGGPGGSPYSNGPQTSQDANQSPPRPTPTPTSFQAPGTQQPYQEARPTPVPPSPFAQRPPVRVSQRGIYIPDPTVIVMRPRRPRGLIISMSVLVTLGLVVGGLLAYGNLNKSASSKPADQPAAIAAAPTPAADNAGAAAVAQTPPAVEQAAGPGAPQPGAAAIASPAAPPAPATTEQAVAAAAQQPPAAAPADPGTRPASSALAASSPGAARSEAIKPSPAPAWLQLTVVPAEATVTVGGESYSGSTLQRMGPFEPGPHELVISAPGYETLEQIVELEPGETERMSLSLPAVPQGDGKIRVRSKPSGATVLVDGKVRGVTPITMELAAGRTYELALSHQGYEPWRTVIEPTVGKTQKFGADMVRSSSSRSGSSKPEADSARAAIEPVAAEEPEEDEPVEAPAPDEPPVAKKAPAVKQERDIAVPVDVVGNASRGQKLVERCRSCHGKSAPALNPRDSTQTQWNRFFAYRRHSRHAELRPLFSASELADVKAHLLENAADAKRGMAAGVR